MYIFYIFCVQNMYILYPYWNPCKMINFLRNQIVVKLEKKMFQPTFFFDSVEITQKVAATLFSWSLTLPIQEHCSCPGQAGLMYDQLQSISNTEYMPFYQKQKSYCWWVWSLVKLKYANLVIFCIGKTNLKSCKISIVFAKLIFEKPYKTWLCEIIWSTVPKTLQNTHLQTFFSKHWKPCKSCESCENNVAIQNYDLNSLDNSRCTTGHKTMSWQTHWDATVGNYHNITAPYHRKNWERTSLPIPQALFPISSTGNREYPEMFEWGSHREMDSAVEFFCQTPWIPRFSSFQSF